MLETFATLYDVICRESITGIRRPQECGPKTMYYEAHMVVHLL